MKFIGYNRSDYYFPHSAREAFGSEFHEEAEVRILPIVRVAMIVLFVWCLTCFL